jgi:hypothetical protein
MKYPPRHGKIEREYSGIVTQLGDRFEIDNSTDPRLIRPRSVKKHALTILKYDYTSEDVTVYADLANLSNSIIDEQIYIKETVEETLLYRFTGKKKFTQEITGSLLPNPIKTRFVYRSCPSIDSD